MLTHINLRTVCSRGERTISGMLSCDSTSNCVRYTRGQVVSAFAAVPAPFADMAQEITTWRCNFVADTVMDASQNGGTNGQYGVFGMRAVYKCPTHAPLLCGTVRSISCGSLAVVTVSECNVSDAENVRRVGVTVSRFLLSQTPLQHSVQSNIRVRVCGACGWARGPRSA